MSGGAHDRLSLNLATVRGTPLGRAVDAATSHGIRRLGLWRENLIPHGPRRAARLIADAGMRISGLCHSAPLVELDELRRRAAHDDNLRAIDDAGSLRAEGGEETITLTIVAGGLPEGSRDLAGARERARDALGAVADHARAAGVRLGIEPFHPVLAADRGVIASLHEAVVLAEHFPSDVVGIVLDSWHVWWDADLTDLIVRSRERLFGVQVADWLPGDPLVRGFPGEGAIDFTAFLGAVDRAGYLGAIEVEIFSPRVWAQSADITVARAASAFDDVIAPTLSE